MIPLWLSGGGGAQLSIRKVEDCDVTVSPTGPAEGAV